MQLLSKKIVMTKDIGIHGNLFGENPMLSKPILFPLDLALTD
jgi:hypothetical protein